MELISGEGSVERDGHTFKIYPDVIDAEAFELLDWEKSVLNTSEPTPRAKKKYQIQTLPSILGEPERSRGTGAFHHNLPKK